MSDKDRELAFLINDCVKTGEQLEMRRGWAIVQLAQDFPTTDDAYQARFPFGSDEGTAINGLLYWTELMGFYTRKGWIPKDVMADVLSISSIWPKLEPVIKDMRAKYSEPKLYVDTEYLASIG